MEPIIKDSVPNFERCPNVETLELITNNKYSGQHLNRAEGVGFFFDSDLAENLQKYRFGPVEHESERNRYFYSTGRHLESRCHGNQTFLSSRGRGVQ